jgi:hypothetical protein
MAGSLRAILGGLLASSLILWLEHPGSLTGDTHLCSGLVVLLSPIQNTSCPSAGLWFFGPFLYRKHLPHPTCSSITQGNFYEGNRVVRSEE